MKQLLIAVLFLFAVVGCKKEEITTTPTVASMPGSWTLVENFNGQAPITTNIVLAHNLSVTGGTWSLSGTTFTMTRYSTTYSGTASGSSVSGTTVPAGTFTMTR